MIFLFFCEPVAAKGSIGEQKSEKRAGSLLGDAGKNAQCRDLNA